MNKIKLMFGLMLGSVLVSCNDDLSPKDYAHWIEDPANGLTVTKKENAYQFTFNYKPVEYMVAMQFRKAEIEEDVLKTEAEKMKDMQYYTLQLSKNGRPVFSDAALSFPEKEVYLISGLERDMALLEGKDTLHCKIFHFEGANGLLPYDNCVLAFEKRQADMEDKTLLFKADKLGMDWVKIKIKAADINRIPKLKTI